MARRVGMVIFLRVVGEVVLLRGEWEECLAWAGWSLGWWLVWWMVKSGPAVLVR